MVDISFLPKIWASKSEETLAPTVLSVLRILYAPLEDVRSGPSRRSASTAERPMIVIASTLHATFRDTSVPSVRFAGNMESPPKLGGTTMSGRALAAVAGAAMLTATSVPSNAFTLSSPSLEQPMASFGVEDVWWGRGGWGCCRPWGWGWHRPWGWGWHRPWAGDGGARSAIAGDGVAPGNDLSHGLDTPTRARPARGVLKNVDWRRVQVFRNIAR